MDKYLNERLCAAITQKQIDKEHIEQLINEGADPLGPLFDEKDTAIGELFLVAGTEGISDNIPVIVEMFIEKGLDCARFSKTDGDSHMELWSLVHSSSEGACEALKIMIENNLRVSALEDFICHFYEDCEYCDGSEMDDEYEEYITWSLKTIMMCASYPKLLKESKYLRLCIEMNDTNKENDYDLTKFKNYNEYEYYFDLSTIDTAPYGLRNAGVEIRRKETGEVVWRLHI